MIYIETLDLTSWIFSILIIGFLAFVNQIWGWQSLAIAHAKLDFLSKKLSEMDVKSDPEAEKIAQFLQKLIAASRDFLPYSRYFGLVGAFSAKGLAAYARYEPGIDIFAREIGPKYQGAAQAKFCLVQRECFRAVFLYANFGSPLGWLISPFIFVFFSLIAVPILIGQIMYRKFGKESSDAPKILFNSMFRKFGFTTWQQIYQLVSNNVFASHKLAQ